MPKKYVPTLKGRRGSTREINKGRGFGIVNCFLVPNNIICTQNELFQDTKEVEVHRPNCDGKQEWPVWTLSLNHLL